MNSQSVNNLVQLYRMAEVDWTRFHMFDGHLLDEIFPSKTFAEASERLLIAAEELEKAMRREGVNWTDDNKISVYKLREEISTLKQRFVNV